MTPINIQDIVSFIQTRFLGGGALGPDDDLLLSGKIDSLGIVALIAFVEELRGAPIPAEDVTIENFATVSAMDRYLNG